MATETTTQSHLQSAIALVQAREDLRAIEAFQQALDAKEIDAQNAFAWNAWGVALYRLGKHPEAVDKLRRAQEINPSYVEAYSNMGAALAGQQKYDEAIKCYSRATEINPHYATAYSNWGNSLLRLKRYPEAIEKYERATQEDPQNGGAYNSWGWALFCLERLDDAVVQYQRAVQFPESAADAHNNWGLALQRQKRYQEAAEHYRQAVAIKSNYVAAYNNWGDALSELARLDQTQGNGAVAARRHKEAAERYLEALRLDAKSAKFDNLVARLDQVSREDRENLSGKLRATIDGLEQDARISAYTNWGNALYTLKKFDEAALKYERAISIRDDFYAYLNWGLALYNQQKHEDAIRRFRDAKRYLDITNPAAIANLYCQWGNALQSLKRYVEAAQQYEKAAEKVAEKVAQGAPAIRLDPEAEAELKQLRADAYFGWGIALANQRLYTDAIAKQQKAVELDRNYAYAYHNAASYLWLQGKYEEAWPEWTKAREAYERTKPKAVERQDSDLFQYYGTLLHRMFWRLEEAESAYRDGLKIKPDHIGIRIGKVNLYLSQQDNGQDRAGAHWKARETYVEARRLLDEQLKAEQLKESWQADFYLQRGELELLMGDYEEAEKDLVKARELDLDGDSPDGCINLGVLWMWKENFERAVQYFDEARRRDPDNLKARAYLAGAYLKAKRVADAESAYQDILAVAPRHVESRIGLGEVYTAMGEDGETDLYQEAIENFDAAVALSTSGGASTILRGKELAAVYYSRGYARTKLYQSDQGKDHGPRLKREVKKKLLLDARNDFQSCRDECQRAGCTAGDPELLRAKRVLEKLKEKTSQSPATWLEDAGPWILVALSLVLLLATQYSFFRGGRVNDVKYYVALTFGSLMFMLAALCLPQLSKFKISGISLEKSPVEKASEVTMLKISRGAGIGLNPTLSFFSADRYAKVKKESDEVQVSGSAG